MNGMMRGKYTPLAKGLSAGGTGVSCLLYSARGGDNLTIDFWADFDNGFPKIVGLPDYDTVTRCPWRPDTAAVLCDFYMEDGTPCPMDARQILKNVVAEYARARARAARVDRVRVLPVRGRRRPDAREALHAT